MLKIGNVTFDCESPGRVAEFWGAALGYTVQTFNEQFAAATHPEEVRPMLLFIKVPEPRTVKNWVHLDMQADDREAEVELGFQVAVEIVVRNQVLDGAIAERRERPRLRAHHRLAFRRHRGEAVHVGARDLPVSATI